MSSYLQALPPLSRDGEGKMFIITPKQKRRVRSLIRKECCNYDQEHGDCILLGHGEGRTCPQMISSQIVCSWFCHSLLKSDQTLYAEVTRDSSRRKCAICGTMFLPGSNRAKYCPACKEKVHRKQKTESERKRRAVVDK